MSSNVLAAVLGIVSLLLLSVVKRNSVVGLILSPIGIFSISYVSIYFLIPAASDLLPTLQVWGYFASGGSREANISLTAFFLFFLATILGVSVTRSNNDGLKARDRLQILQGSPELGKVTFAVAILFATGVVAMVFVPRLTAVLSAIATMTDSQVMGDRIGLARGWGYVRAPTFLASVLTILLLLLVQRSKTRSKVVGALAIGLVLFVNGWANVGLGGRLPILMPIVYTCFAWSLMGPARTTNWRVSMCIVAGVACLVGASYGGMLRSQFLGDKHASRLEGALGEMVLTEVRNSFSQAELFVLCYDSRSSWELAYGETMLAALVNFVPRAWWPSKPLGGGPMAANIVRPGSYSLDSSFASSRTTGIPLEAYLNFGLIGVGVIGFVYGLVISLVTIYGQTIARSYQFVLYVLALFAVGEMCVYQELNGAVTRWGQMAIPLAILGRLFSSSRGNTAASGQSAKGGRSPARPRWSNDLRTSSKASAAVE